MSNKQAFKFISCIEQEDGSIDITVPAAMNKDFKCLVKRAINTWPDQSPYIRDFADRLFQQDHLMQGNMLEAISKELGQSLADNSNGIVEMVPVDNVQCQECSAFLPGAHADECSTPNG